MKVASVTSMTNAQRIAAFQHDTQYRNHVMRSCAAEYRDIKILRAAGDYMIKQTGAECAPLESQLMILEDILASELRLKGF
jgi:hypothetical protein